MSEHLPEGTEEKYYYTTIESKKFMNIYTVLKNMHYIEYKHIVNHKICLASSSCKCGIKGANFSLLSLENESEAYDITMLSVCVPH
jgi:hypothetical protein